MFSGQWRLPLRCVGAGAEGLESDATGEVL